MDLDSAPSPGAGVFVVFEGIDGSGKSTVATAVARRLKQEFARDVVLTREPGGTPLGEGVRELVLSAASTGITPVSELLLFSAARAQHVALVIEPQLRRGSIVVCDRFTDSTLAYQWGGRGLARSTVEAAQDIATAGVTPDLRVLLDLPVEVALLRRLGETDSVNRFDAEHLNFHRSVRAAYLQLAGENRDGWLTVDASGPAVDVLETTYRSVSTRVHELLELGSVVNRAGGH